MTPMPPTIQDAPRSPAPAIGRPAGIREHISFLRRVKAKADARYGAFSRFIQFCAVGSSGVLVDLGVYAALLHIDSPHGKLWRFAAMWVALTWNFWLNRRLTFSHSRRYSWLPQYGGFALTCSLGMAINWSLSTVVLPGTWPFFGQHLLLAALVGIAGGTVSNFLLSFLWVFRQNRSKAPTEPIK